MGRRFGSAPRDLAGAARWLASGGVLAIPTETFYGLAVDPRDAAAVAALRRLKGRPPGEGLPLVAADPLQVERCAPGWDADRRVRALAARFWPGPLSLVLAVAGDLARGVAAADGTVAVRITAHPVARDLCRTFGGAIVATSANRRGEPPAVEAEAVAAAFGDEPRIAVLDAGPVTGGRPSTLVRIAPSGDVLVLREGAVERREIDAALGRAGPRGR